jgi:hypothetical protein
LTKSCVRHDDHVVELVFRYPGTGKPVTGLRIAVTPGRYDRDTSRYVDGTTTFVDGQV